MKFNPTAATLATLVTLLMPATALAHPKLVTAIPAANATVSPTSTVTLTFSERLMPKLSSATLTTMGGPGAAHHAPKQMTDVTSRITADGKSIILSTASPLPAGAYRADWIVVSVDTHRVTGAHSFSVE